MSSCCVIAYGVLAQPREPENSTNNVVLTTVVLGCVEKELELARNELEHVERLGFGRVPEFLETSLESCIETNTNKTSAY
jgi:hypothetical protein